MVFIQGYKCKNTGNRFFPAFLIHLFDKNIDPHFHACIANMLNSSNELNDGTGRNRMGKINSIG